MSQKGVIAEVQNQKQKKIEDTERADASWQASQHKKKHQRSNAQKKGTKERKRGGGERSKKAAPPRV